MSRLDDCRLIELPRVADARGTLTYVEGIERVPFRIRRVFYVCDVPAGASRGAHAHRDAHQFLICLAGSLDVVLDDGVSKRTVRLDRSSHGLYIPPMVWATETHFAPGCIYLAFASDDYDEGDYVRDYGEFARLAAARGAADRPT